MYLGEPSTFFGVLLAGVLRAVGDAGGNTAHERIMVGDIVGDTALFDGGGIRQ